MYDFEVLTPANDNSPLGYDPCDWDDFDPAMLPADMFYSDDTPLDVCEFMALLSR